MLHDDDNEEDPAFAFLLLLLARRLMAIRGRTALSQCRSYPSTKSKISIALDTGSPIVSKSITLDPPVFIWFQQDDSFASIYDDDCSEEDTTKEMISLSMERIEQQGDLIQFGIWTPVTH
jgi:hypothetical protein